MKILNWQILGKDSNSEIIKHEVGMLRHNRPAFVVNATQHKYILNNLIALVYHYSIKHSMH
jgi:hypothetical protein